jgi:chromosome partitioning protein
MVITIANPKGGVGKSVLATNIAAIAAARGHSVTFFDTDVQRSGGKWCDQRRNLGIRPRIDLLIPKDDLFDELQAASQSSDVVVVDVKGTGGPALTIAAGLADLVVVPVIPGQFEVWALDDAADLIESLRATGAGFRCRAVINNAPTTRNSRDVRTVTAALKAYKQFFEPCDTVIFGRQVFKDALSVGLSVIEMDGGARDVKATENINTFFNEAISNG